MKANSKTKWGIGISLLIIAVAASIFYLTASGTKKESNNIMAATSEQSFKGNTTYYLDSANGNDANDGTSEKKAWKSLDKVNSYKGFGPGDKILFKAGSIFNGPLKLVYSQVDPTLTNCKGGVEGNPIVIDMYGRGPKPLIQGSGEDKEFAAVYLKNVQYIEVNNLLVTNQGDFSRRGIYVTAAAEDFPNTTQEAPAVLNHIYIKNCEIKDVDSKPLGMSSPSKCFGGIIFKITSGKECENWVRYNDVLVSNNYIHDVSRCGMYTHSDFNTDLPYTKGGGEGTRPRLPWTKVVVRNNYVSDTAGDGLVVTTCDAPLMEYNVVARPQRFTASDLYAVGMWPFGCYDAVLQYNEAFGNQTRNDGMGFDLDFGNKRAILQYNYSHDNEGGFVLVCSGPGVNEHPVVRYNISQNDGCTDNSRIFQISGMGTKDCWVYNNTIYTAANPGLAWMESKGVWQGTPELITFVNNIYVNRSTQPRINDIYEPAQMKIDRNSFFGMTPPADAANSIKADPLLVKPGSGTTGGRIDLGEKIGNADGYKLQAGSPCINAGISIENNGGKDYWGNGLYNGAPDIGACEFDGSTTASAGEEDSSKIKNQSKKRTDLLKNLFPGEDTVVARVSGYPVYARELRQRMEGRRADVYGYILNKYGAQDSENFWRTSFDGEIPGEIVKKAAMEESIRIKVQQILARENGILKDDSYLAFLNELEKENERRKDAIKGKQIIYGPEEYGEAEFFSYAFSNMVIRLKEKLNKNELLVPEETRKILDRDKIQSVDKRYNQLIESMIQNTKIEVEDTAYDKIGEEL
ncbi:MAG: right-handed parallel beta-helix repeat-containing protein [Clostridia bacterium]|nr:right-handed parallel beta-helix repeat-containing protein [Clostridia bacterium]